MIGFYRLALAVLHWNANAQREQALTQEGEQRYAMDYPKARHRQATFKDIKEISSKSYGKQLHDIKLPIVISVPEVNINSLTTALE